MPELVVPTVADAGRIAAVINARSLALDRVTEESADGVARWFADPILDPAADMRLALGDRGEALGYADVSGPGDGSPKAWVDLRVLPHATEALDVLLGWAERRAEERAGKGGVIQFFVNEHDREVRSRLEASGFVVVRSSYEMERALEGPLEAPVWPVGLEARPFGRRDAEAVHAAQVEAFADHWGYEDELYDSWCAHNLGGGADTSLWRIVWDGDDIAGLTINRPRRGEDESMGWIAVLAVRRPWRRRGLGEALLRDAFVSFAARGKQSAGLGVDAENTTGALALYERVGMHVVRRSDTWERAA